MSEQPVVAPSVPAVPRSPYFTSGLGGVGLWTTCAVGGCDPATCPLTRRVAPSPPVLERAPGTCSCSDRKCTNPDASTCTCCEPIGCHPAGCGGAR